MGRYIDNVSNQVGTYHHSCDHQRFVAQNSDRILFFVGVIKARFVRPKTSLNTQDYVLVQHIRIISVYIYTVSKNT